jgi:hypothetical protein
MADNIPFTELDFDQIKENLKTYLKGQAQFKDYDFEGSNMNVLLDVLAANTFQNNFYRNMAFSEMFMDSATMRENVASHAKELGYIPGSRKSAKALLNITLNNVTGNPNFITIPKGTKFNAQCGNKSFTFLTDKNHSVVALNGKYSITDVDVYEGKIVREYYTVGGDNDPSEYIINNENVDIDSVRVYVRDNVNEVSTKNEYIRKTSIFGVTAVDRVFYLEPYFDNLYKIDFGRDKFGRQPASGNVIEVEYRVTKGTEANGARNFTPVNNIAGFPGQVTNDYAAINGAMSESIEDIKFFATKSIQTQERAVTRSDYEILLKQRFPSIQAISVYGGDELEPPQYGKVYISVDVIGSIGAGDSEIIAFKEYIREKTPLTIEPVFRPAEFMYTDINLRVNYDPLLTTKTSADIASLVKSTVESYSESNLNQFGITLRQSRIVNTIDTADVSITSSELISKAIIEYTPILNRITNPAFDFGNQLQQPYPLDEVNGFANYTPAISSSTFTIDGVEVILQDDGLGNMIAVTSASATRRVFKRAMGTVNYLTGQVKLSNFRVSSFSGNQTIKVYANTLNKDIKAPKDRILIIRPEDITINVRSI